MGSVVWMAAAALLALSELLMGELFLLMAAGGALSAAAAAALGAPLWAEIAVFCVVSVLLVGTVRPIVRRHLLSSTSGYESLEDSVRGEEALVTEDISADAGMIRLRGELWSARPAAGIGEIPSGSAVTVLSVEGATAIVIPQASLR